MDRTARVTAVCLLGVVSLTLAACSGEGGGGPAPAGAADRAEVTVGERLFLETRFAQFFASHLRDDDVNQTLDLGDPTVAHTQTRGTALEGPFAGTSMNCRACHLVDEHGETFGGGVRTYSDFARRSPVPARADGRTETERNAPALVDATLPRAEPFILHFDGEFASTAGLVAGTLTGRNLGWLADERDIAVAHIARVIREDDGSGELAAEFGALPYRDVLTGNDPNIPPDFQLPESLRIDVASASDAELVDGVSRVISAYVESLVFIQDANGEFDGSAYDRFLAKNGLPRAPEADESPREYSRRLRALVGDGTGLTFVTSDDGRLRHHDHPFAFGERELAGFKIFFTEPDGAATRGVGNCIACHPAPTFSDFRVHNTGVSQDEYDRVHGGGAFEALDIPALAARNADPARYLPASAAFPNAPGAFRSPPISADPTRADLGVWNVYANPAIPRSQAALNTLLCEPDGLAGDGPCEPEAVLPRTIGAFKTPSLRSLGQSAPYMHPGDEDTLEDVLRFYVRSSDLAHAGRLRNADREIVAMQLTPDDVDAVAAFLRALDEDYE